MEGMCRSIKVLFHFDPPVTETEVEAACLQFVRKISGFRKPSRRNEQAFARAVEEMTRLSWSYLGELQSSAPKRKRPLSEPSSSTPASRPPDARPRARE